MPDHVLIEKRPIRFASGIYEPGKIILKVGLPPEKEKATLRHELKHHEFYLKHKLMRPFFYPRFLFTYCFFTFSVGFLSLPWIYLALATPILIMLIQEIWISTLPDSKNLKSVVESCIFFSFIFNLFLVKVI